MTASRMEHAQATLPGVVARYAARMHATTSGHHVINPVGAWTLLALSTDAVLAAREHGGVSPDPDTFAGLEELLGAPVDLAARWARQLLTAPPDGVHIGHALWCEPDQLAPGVNERLHHRFPGLTTGPIPNATELDAWAKKASRDLIRGFPLNCPSDTPLVLASTAAIQGLWHHSFVGDIPIPFSSSWPREVTRLMASDPTHRVQLWHSPDGIVVCHQVATNGMVFHSVIGARSVSPATMLEYAHTLAMDASIHQVHPDHEVGSLPGGLHPVSDGELRALSAGEHGILDIVDDSHVSPDGDIRMSAGLPHWGGDTHVETPHLPGLAHTSWLLSHHLGEATTLTHARAVSGQRSRVHFTPTGCDTPIGEPHHAAVHTVEPGVRRFITARFIYPYAVVGTARDVTWIPNTEPGGRAQPLAGPWHGAPVFSAWVARVLSR